MEVLLKCTNLKHQYDVAVTRICLGKNCQIKRMICDDCLNLHQDHVDFCYALPFLKEILINERDKIRFVMKQNLSHGVIAQISSLEQKMNNAIKQLIEQQYFQIKDLIQLSENCINGVIEQIIYNFIYNDQSKEQLEIIKQYPDDDANYLIQKFLQQGDSCQISGNNYLALQKYEAAQTLNESVNNVIANETIKEKQIQLHLSSNDIEKAQSLSAELMDHYHLTNDTRQTQNSYTYRRLTEFKNNPELQPAFSQMSQLIGRPSQTQINDCEKQYLYLLGFQLLLLKEYEQAVQFYEYCLNMYPMDLSFVQGKIRGLIGSKMYNIALTFTQQKLQQFPANEQLIQLKHYLQMYTDKEYLEKQGFDATYIGLLVQCFSNVLFKNFKKALQCIEQLEKFNVSKYLSLAKGILLIQLGEKLKGFSVLKSIDHNINPISKVLILRLTEEYTKGLETINNSLNEYSTHFRMWIERYSILFERGYIEDLQQIEVYGELQDEVFLNRPKPNFIRYGEYSGEISISLSSYPRIILIRALTQFKLAQFDDKLRAMFLEKSLINVENLLTLFNKIELEYIKGKILFNQNKYEEAENLIDKSMISTQDARFSFFKGVLLYQRGYYQKAILMFEDALNLDKTLWPAIYNKGIALIQSKQNYKEAEQCFTLTIKHKIKSKLLIAYCQLFQGNIGNAIALIKDYQVNLSNSRRSIQLGSSKYQNIGKLEDLFVEIDPIVKLNQGLNHIQSRNIENLQQWVNQVQSYRYCQNIALLLKAKYYHQNNNLVKALECYNQCLQDDQDCLLALYGKLQILKSSNQSEDTNEIQRLTYSIRANGIDKLDNFETLIFQYCIHQFASVKELEIQELKTVDDKLDILNCLIDIDGFAAYYSWVLYGL